MKAQELAKRLQSRDGVCVLDVRSGMEYRAGHIPGALHSPSWKILFRLAPLPKEKGAEVVVTCEHGPRAQVAASLLTARGYTRVSLLDGHMAGWRRAGLPLEK